MEYSRVNAARRRLGRLIIKTWKLSRRLGPDTVNVPKRHGAIVRQHQNGRKAYLNLLCVFDCDERTLSNGHPNHDLISNFHPFKIDNAGQTACSLLLHYTVSVVVYCTINSFVVFASLLSTPHAPPHVSYQIIPVHFFLFHLFARLFQRYFPCCTQLRCIGVVFAIKNYELGYLTRYIRFRIRKKNTFEITV